MEKIETNPLNIEIKFDEKFHKYSSNINNKEISYISVTSLIDSFYIPFDAEKIAKSLSFKRKIPKEDIIAEWDENRNAALKFGTRVHKVAESVFLNTESLKPESKREEDAFNCVINTANKIKNNFEIIGVEKIVFDHRLKIAGTLDLLLKKNGFYLIVDWKTNKEISNDNKFNKFGLGPLHDVADTSFTRYALQLSMYEYLLKYVGYIPKNVDVYRVLMHITPVNKIEKIHLPNMEKIVRDIVIDVLLN